MGSSSSKADVVDPKPAAPAPAPLVADPVQRADDKIDDDDANFIGRDIQLKKFREEKVVQGSTRRQLAQTLRGTVRQRRERTRAGLEKDPMLRDLVQLPQGQILNDWIAVNTIHFYNIVSIIYGSCQEFCTATSCPVMSAGPKYQYLWSDTNDGKSPRAVSAPEYMALLFDWIEACIGNAAIFPSATDDYPDDFIKHVKTIHKRIFRVYGHVYYSHFEQIKKAGAELQLNSSFQHFAFFACEFGLLHSEDMRPLNKLLAKLLPGFSPE
ncbi:Mob1/phocein family [Plasmodiophora brassicae]